MPSPKTAPGVYTTVIDQSFLPQDASRFRAGLIGVATKGAFNTPTRVRTLKEFVQLFGQPVPATSGISFYLADAVAILSDFSDGTIVTRVGAAYQAVSNADASGSSGTYQLFTPKAALFNPDNFDSDVYVRVKQTGKATTINAIIENVFPSAVPPYVTLQQPPTVDSMDDFPALQADYTDADVSFSLVPNAANNAESVLYGYEYGSELTSAGTITGDKNSFTFFASGAFGSIEVGSVYKITQDNRDTTLEVRVKQVLETSPLLTVSLEPANIAEVGYQALSLQDSYTNGRLFKVDTKVEALFMEAATPGTWANGSTATTGLYVKVLPGGAAGTKKLEIYENGGLVETFDNLSDDATSANYYETRINGISQYITVSAGQTPFVHPANTAAPWNTSLTTSTTPKSMPFGAVNEGAEGGVDGSFDKGANGELAGASDFIGTVDPSDDSLTGVKVYEDTDNIDVDVIVAPDIASLFAGELINGISPQIGVMQEMARVAKKVNAIALFSVPAGLNLREATDWHNGAGVYTGQGRLDTAYGAVYWNWWQTTDRFSTDPTVTKFVPPTIAALRAMAFTFDNDKPWYAAAGENRGLIPEALQLEFNKFISDDARSASYGDGNSINPILNRRGRILLFGERTLQRAESKLSVVHSVVLVNYVVKNLAEIGRKFVFDPNDAELLTHIRLAFSEFLDKVHNERGIEDYNLVIDDSNNTADTRNRREVIVDLFLIPTDTVERIFINATVRESGADLNAVSG